MEFEYLARVSTILEKIGTEEKENLNEAVTAMTDAILNRHALWCFGSGHAGMIAQEMFYRAGSLLLVNPIFGPGLAADSDPVTLSTKLERLEGYGRLLAEQKADFSSGDVLILHSVSGRNAVIIDMALAAKEAGVTVIAITAKEVSRKLKARHSSGKRLFEIADIVIDNHGEEGDAVIEVPGLDQKCGSTSTIAAAAIAQILETETIKALAGRGMEDIPVLKSANIPGGDEHNEKLFEIWKDRIHYRA